MRRMAGEPDNLVLEHLRQLRAKLDQHDERFNEILLRLSELGSGQAAMRRDQALDAEGSAHLAARVDRLRDEIERIKRRLELTD